MHEIATLRPHLRDRHLGELYPAKVARGSFDYQLGKAETYLADASGFLFDASFISCQPAYEHYLAEVVELVADAAGVSPPVGNGVNPPSIPKRHRWLAAQSVVIGDGWLELFDVLREARNSYVHAGGRVAQRLVDARLTLTADGQAHWKRVAGEELPAMNLDDRLAVGTFDPIAAIYTIGNLGLEVNRALQRSNLIALERWADVAVRDYRQRNAGGGTRTRRRASGASSATRVSGSPRRCRRSTTPCSFVVP